MARLKLKGAMAAKYPRCVAPDCDGDGKSNLGLCRKHNDMFNFIIWAIKVMQSGNEGKTPSGLYLPKQSSQKKGGE